MISCVSGEVTCQIEKKDIEVLEELGLIDMTILVYGGDSRKASEVLSRTIYTADLCMIFRTLISNLGKEQGLKIMANAVDKIQKQVEEGEI